MLSLSTPPTLLTLIIPPISIIIILRLSFFLRRPLRHVSDLLHSHQTFVIPRLHNVTPNPLFRKSLAYVTSLPSLEDSDRVQVFSSTRKNNDFYALPDPTNTVVSDYFHGAHLRWSLHESSLHLRVRRKDRHRVLRPYLQHVELVGDDIEAKRKEVKLHSINNVGSWESVLFTHPATFDTLVAMDEELTVKIKSDLEAFAKGRGYYNRIGKVWKRSYVLYGRPGSGKSAFVAAMAKFLNYDVYEFDLSKVKDVKSLLLQTSPKSVILVENFDRYAAEMLIFTEGVFSSCGEERLYVYTTNAEKEEDVKTVRSDVQVYFPLCDFNGFKNLASSYLGVKDHKLYSQVKEGFERGAKLSQDEIGEIMITNRGSPSRAIKNVINALHKSSPEVNSEIGDTVVNSGGFGKEATVREIKKLYGLIRRSGSKKEGIMSIEMAAAAAAAANGGGGGGGGGGFEKESS